MNLESRDSFEEMDNDEEKGLTDLLMYLTSLLKATDGDDAFRDELSSPEYILNALFTNSDRSIFFLQQKIYK